MKTISSLMQGESITLIIGLLAGIVVLMLLRAWQVYAQRRAFGYNTYTASKVRRLLLRWALIGAVLLVFTAALYILISSQSEISNETQPRSVSGAAPQETIRLIIPLLAVDTVMIEAPFIGEEWDISGLTNQVAHLEGTAYPGQEGNAVFVGHVTIPDINSAGPFYELENLTVCDQVFVRVGSRTLTYRVSALQAVQPADAQVMYPTTDTRLTLITCTGWNGEQGTHTEQFVVIAQPVP